MEKKFYQTPAVAVVNICTQGMLATSDGSDFIPVEPEPDVPASNEVDSWTMTDWD
ncbi:MAG: hypothetical protein J6R79_06180 [Bacteroidaceae bacterium]|nr:hypothetical protein [Bacteroidaceae bacterium]